MLLSVPGWTSSPRFPATVTRPDLTAMPEVPMATLRLVEVPAIGLEEGDHFPDFHG
jgi:hypothetical protein